MEDRLNFRGVLKKCQLILLGFIRSVPHVIEGLKYASKFCIYKEVGIYSLIQ